MRKTGPVGQINEKTYQAEAVITGGYAVAHGVADNGCAPVTQAGQRCLGIASEPQITIGGAVPVVRDGDVLAVAGGAINFGDYLKADAAGRVVPSTAAGDEIVGRAESSAVNLGDQIIVFVRCNIR